VSFAGPTKYHAYSLGAHNIIIQIFSRGGILGVFLFAWAHALVYIPLGLRSEKITSASVNRLFNRVFFATAMIICSALTFPMIETPLYASYYWILFGLAANLSQELTSKKQGVLPVG